jgi:soluble epoxide hydrolase/lipid-phosphate phosphatase
VTSQVLKNGGWFGGHPEELRDIPLEDTFLDESLYQNLVKSHEKHGFFPPTAYYLNHDVNVEYAKREKNGGVLEFPVLYIGACIHPRLHVRLELTSPSADAKYDGVCSPSTTPKFKEVQSKFTRDLSYETIESGHWAQLQKPKETNEAMEKWLHEKF